MLRFTHEQQKKCGITAPKQALAMFRPDVRQLLTSMRTDAQLSIATRPHHRIALARDIALFEVGFQTGGWWSDDFHHASGSGVLRLPDGEGFIINILGKILRTSTWCGARASGEFHVASSLADSGTPTLR